MEEPPMGESNIEGEGEYVAQGRSARRDREAFERCSNSGHQENSNGHRYEVKHGMSFKDSHYHGPAPR